MLSNNFATQLTNQTIFMNKIKTLFLGTSLCTASIFAQNNWTGSAINTTTLGNIGIGTTSPISSLEIHDQNSQILLRSTGSTVGISTQYLPSITLKTNSQTYFFGTEYIGPNNEILRIRDLNSTNNGGITFLKDKVYIGANNGRAYENYPAEVLLGKTWVDNLSIGGKFASDSKLSVAGKATFLEIEVKPYITWPDYVFAKNYNLASLDSVASFIETNSHLPNVPSAKQVEEDGINLAQMDAVLLQKIEELTLYNIQMYKQLEAMKAEIALLKKN